MKIESMRMKIVRNAFLLGFFFYTASVMAEKPIEEYLADLNSSDMQVQIEACQYLGEKKEVSAVESLVFLLEDEGVDSHVKVASANALASIGKQAGVSAALLRSAQESKNPSVRYASFLALASLEDEEKEADMKELVVDLMKSSDPYLRDLAQKIALEYEKKQ